MIKFGSFFRFSLLLPIVLGVLSWFIGIDSPFFILWVSLELAGAPFLLFAAALFIWSRKQSDKEIMLTTVFIPIFFVPFCTIGMFIILGTPYSVKTLLESLWISIIFGLAVGYFYILIGWIGYYLVNKIYKYYLNST